MTKDKDIMGDIRQLSKDLADIKLTQEDERELRK